MTKETYIKPDVISENLVPEVLCCTGSNVGGTNNKWLDCAPRPSCGFCCDDE